MKRFTDQQIKSMQPEKNAYLRSEPGGLYIRVFPTGKKVWLHVYSFDGKRRWYRLGEYPITDLSTARSRLRNVLELLDAGKDPAEEKLKEKTERRQSPTIEALAEEYLQKWAKPNKKTWQEDKRCLFKDVVPAWKGRKAKDITKRDVILLLENIVERGAPIQANNTFEKIRKMFNWAQDMAILAQTPCAGVRAPTKRKPKTRNLSPDEIRQLWFDLHSAAMSDEVIRALKLILVTAQRPGEVIGLHSSEIDGNWWTIPERRTKNGRAHRVFLSSMAKNLIGEKEGFVFESPKGKKPIHVNALAHALRKSFELNNKTKTAKLQIAHFTPHDLRRTATTQMARIGFSLVVDKVLNHTDTRVTATYNLYEYDKEKRKALEAWSRELESIVIAEKKRKVIPFAR